MSARNVEMPVSRWLFGPQNHWRFSPHDGSTRLQWTGEMQLAGPMRRFSPLIARSFSTSAETNFARLKWVLEVRAGATTR